MYSVYHIHHPNMKVNEGYIGVTNNFSKRKHSHLNAAKHNKHNNPILSRILRKYPDIQFTELHINLSKDAAYMCENFYRPKPLMGWNIKAGGEVNIEHSPTTKKKIGDAQRGNLNHMFGKHHSQEARHAISVKNKGKTRTEKHKEILRNYRTDKVMSESTKEKLRDLNIGGKSAKAKKVLCIETDTIFNAVSEAAQWANIHYSGIAKVCAGTQTKAGSYTWKYI